MSESQTLYIPAAYIKQAASEEGFDACGIARAEALSDFSPRLSRWLAEGFHAGMQYMERNEAMRVDPRRLVEGAQSVVSLLVGYRPSRLMTGLHKVAQYAYGEDYHRKLKRMLFALAKRLKEQYPALQVRAFVDTAPISDKSWAIRGGLGWRGKHTLVVHPTLGSYCNIGELVCNATSDYDLPLENSPCVGCRRCVDACPNQALRPVVDEDCGEPHYLLDARRCIAYHTVESRATHLPDHLRLSGFAFGCDRCQQACPVNRQAAVRLQVSAERIAELERLAEADPEAFRLATRHTAMERIGFDQWQRNVGQAPPLASSENEAPDASSC